MPKPRRGPRLGAGPAHEKLMLANQATELFRHGRIKTTQAKAKTLRPFAERLITKAKRGDLHARRQVASKLGDRDVVAWLFDEIAPRYAERNGGYTRMLKLGPRKGDSAPMVFVELVDWSYEEGSAEEEIEERRLDRLRGLFGRGRKSEAEASAEAFEEGPLDEEPEPEVAPDESHDEAHDEADEEAVVDTDAEGDEAAPAAEEAEPALEDVSEPDEAPGPAQEPTAPDEDPGEPVDLADDTPDAGTGDPTKNP